MPLQKNSEHNVTITGYSSDGAGVARAEGQVVFVPGTILGETCRIKIVKAKKNIAYGRLISVENKSPHRIDPECECFPQCGGCHFWHMDYTAELAAKQEHVRSVMTRIGGIQTQISEIVAAPEITRYRNKAQFPVGCRNGQIVSGFYRGHSHDIVPCNDCKIQSLFANAIRRIVLDWMGEFKIAPYDEASGAGVVRHIYVRNTMVCLVVTKKPQHCDALIIKITREFPETTGILLNYQRDNTNVILGEQTETLYGAGSISDTLCGNTFEIGPHAFYQVNHAQAETLYSLVLELGAFTGEETVLDLYCGAGTITLALAQRARRVIGVEIVPQAIENAKRNAEENGIKNVEFLCADAAAAASALEQRGIDVDTIVVDPPRKGLSSELIVTMHAFSPAHIIYVSCDPATLARDLRELKQVGYRTETVVPVDMFPRTKHVETVALLVREMSASPET